MFIKKYAINIDVDYLFELNPHYYAGKLGPYSAHFGALKAAFSNKFDEYDYVLFCDTDIIPKTDLTENIFKEYNGIEFGICEEWNQPEIRLTCSSDINNKNDEKWLKVLKEQLPSLNYPRNKNKLPRVFNSGVVLYSKMGREKAKKMFMDPKKYVDMVIHQLPSFYASDQPYLNIMMNHLNWEVMDYKWNSSVHYTPDTFGSNRPVTDLRTNDTNFVHIQLRGADHYDSDTINRIANLPVKEWNLP